MSKAWFRVVAVLIMLLIGFSRIYLGVHFPTDVFAGWIIGSILLAIYVAARGPLEKWLSGLYMWLQLLLAAGVSAVLLIFNHSNEALTCVGTLFGAAAGLVFAMRYVSFSVSGPWWRRVLRLLIGIIVVRSTWGSRRSSLPTGLQLGRFSVSCATRCSVYGWCWVPHGSSG